MNERERIRKEKLADLCFNLSNTSFGVSVLGALATFAMGVEDEKAVNIAVLLISGCILTIGFTGVGYKLLKEQEDE